MPTVTDERLLDVREVGERFRYSRWTIYRLVRGGVLPAVRIGGTLRFLPSDVEEVIRTGRTEAPAADRRPRAVEAEVAAPSGRPDAASELLRGAGRPTHSTEED